MKVRCGIDAFEEVVAGVIKAMAILATSYGVTILVIEILLRRKK